MASSEAIHVSTRPFPSRRPRHGSRNLCIRYSKRMNRRRPLDCFDPLANAREPLLVKTGRGEYVEKLRLRFEPIQR